MEAWYDVTRLKKAQEANLKLLLEVDRICRAYDIRYMLDAGTLLGAVRHQGFIPWDDDADIVMTRENLDRFVGVARKELKDDFRLVMPYEYRHGTSFYDFTPRIIYLRSRRNGAFGESHDTGSRKVKGLFPDTDTPQKCSDPSGYYEGKLDHLWVDIFVLDNIPDSKPADFVTRFLQKVIYGLSMAKRFSLDMGKYSFMDRILVGVLSFAGRFFNMPFLFRLQDSLSRKYDLVSTKSMYYSNYQPDFLYVTVKREWIEDVTELDFEGHKFYAPKGYKEVLQEIYGDYMKLPPEKDRVPSHSKDMEVF